MTIYAASGAEFDVNSTYTRTQAHSDAATLADGSAIFVWVDADFNISANRYIRAKIYAPDGSAKNVELTLVSGSSFINPAVTGLTGGGFVVTWEGLTTIQAQIFDVNGVAAGAAFNVSPAGLSANGPDVTALDGGGFAISWHDERTSGTDTSRSGVHVRSFDQYGAALQPDTLVNVATIGNQADTSIAALPGGYVVTFTDRGGSSWLIKARIYDAAGAPVGSEFVVNSGAGATSVESSVTVLAGGAFAVAWYETGIAGSGHAIQLFSASGERIGSQINVPSGLAGTQVGPKLVALADGGFALAWTANTGALSDGSGRAVFVQVFDALGQAAGGPMLANNQTVGEQFDPTITALGAGGFIVGWTDSAGAGADDDQVKARIFTPQYRVEITSDGGGDDATVTANENQLSVTHIVATAGSTSADIRYTIDGGEDAGLFTIDTASGLLSFLMVPDFESPWGSDNLYTVQVRASNTYYSDVQTITVSIGDVNEAPRIISNGGGTTASLLQQENSIAVTTVSASDLEGGAVTYAIAGGPDAHLFTIDAATGVLTFINAPDFEAAADFAEDNFYTVVVAASDGTLSSTQRIEILVENVNEAPRITSYGGAATVAVPVIENQQTGALIQATDVDSSAITYAIAGGADAALFTINTATGELRFRAAPDFETPADADRNNVYNVLVFASDGTLSATQMIEIRVENANEAPLFRSYAGGGSVALAVSENQQGAAFVNATDPDGADVTYALAGADANMFMINMLTGELRFKSAPDFEAPSDVGRNNGYEVQVTATDGSLSSVQSLLISVTDLTEAAYIIGTAGNDIISASKTVAGQAFATAYGDRIEGRGGADMISGGGGNDIIDGGAGNDRLNGEAGADMLTGGLGADIFEFASIADSGPATTDRIIDFSRQQGDIISLANIDAKSSTVANDAFKFIGTKAFSKEAGQLRYHQFGGNSYLSGDVNGDAIADFQIEIVGSVKFAANDFIL
jgi:Ca2+-binding RTX toxin-like protein